MTTYTTEALSEMSVEQKHVAIAKWLGCKGPKGNNGGGQTWWLHDGTPYMAGVNGDKDFMFNLRLSKLATP